MDTNENCCLTFEELRAGLKDGANLKQRFKNFKKTGDGKPSLEEFVAPSGKSPPAARIHHGSIEL